MNRAKSIARRVAPMNLLNVPKLQERIKRLDHGSPKSLYLVGWTGGALDAPSASAKARAGKLELAQLRYIALLAVDIHAAERTAQRHVCSACKNALVL
jgi:hypothetical protein